MGSRSDRTEPSDGYALKRFDSARGVVEELRRTSDRWEGSPSDPAQRCRRALRAMASKPH